MDAALLREVHAHQAITDVIYRYGRALDRMDAELALSCWHEGGTDDHAPLFAGTAKEFVEWVWPVHAAMEVTRHVISNIQIALDGDRAGVESYWTVTLRLAGADGLRYDVIGQGRYVDDFACLDDRWAMMHRRSIHEWDRVEPVGRTMADPDVPATVKANNPGAPLTLPRRDRDDYSYGVLRGLGVHR